jgi:Meiotically up-regulated gene 113
MSVYFIYEDPFSNGLAVDPDIEEVVRQNHVVFVREFKVGESNKPHDRVKNLQTGNPRRLYIYKVLECATKKRAKAMEDIIHKRFAHRRNHGEWFTLSKDEVDEICSEICKLNSIEWEKAKIGN